MRKAKAEPIEAVWLTDKQIGRLMRYQSFFESYNFPSQHLPKRGDEIDRLLTIKLKEAREKLKNRDRREGLPE